MKKLNFFLGVLLGTCHSLHAGQSNLYPIMGNFDLTCCSQNMFTIDVENVHAIFAIENVSGTWMVTRQGNVIHQQTNVPRDANIDPGETKTFVLEIPMELLLVGGLLKIDFTFDSDFDLNQNPTKSALANVSGCGIIKEDAIEFFLGALSGIAVEYEAYIFLFNELLCPGTIIQGSNGDTYSTALEASTWMALIYNPLARFEQPMQIALLNSNTMEVQTIEANWYPLVNNIAFYPDLGDMTKIFGTVPPTTDPPEALTSEKVTSMPADSVCAILVSGVDTKDKDLQKSFMTDVDLMRQNLVSRENGPRLPESSVIVKHGKHGYNRDSLIMDLRKLKDKYKKVYFYYSGHGTKSGKMAIAIGAQNWMDYPTFTQELFDSGAESYCLMLDCCYSGGLVNAVCADPRISGIDVEVVTSSDDRKISVSKKYIVEGMVEWYGKFSTQFYWAMGDLMSDGNGDNKIGFTEGYNKVIRNNHETIVENQNPMSKEMNNHTLSVIGNLFLEAGKEIYGTERVDKATIRANPVTVPASTNVISYDGKNEYPLTARSYVGWIDWDPNANFGKPVTFMFMDAVTKNVNFHDGIQFWPTIPNEADYNPFSPDHLFKDAIRFGNNSALNSIFHEIEQPPLPSNTLAFLVTGSHPDLLFQHAQNQSAELFELNLLREHYGEQLEEEDIIVNFRVNPEVLVNIYNTINQQQPEKIIFYYSGIFTNDGLFPIGNDPGEWIDYQTFFSSLVNSSINEYTFFFDASYSGSIVDFLKQSNLFKEKRLNVFTSSNSTSQSYVDIFVDPQQQVTDAYTSMTYHLMQDYGDPAAESDNVDRITLNESFNSLYGRLPLIIERQLNPVSLSGRYVASPADNPENINLQDLDLEVQMYTRSALEIYASQELNVRPQASSSADVFAISPVRQWKLEGAWDIDPTLAADILFHYNEDIDLLADTAGVLGLVSRSSPDEEWEAYYPVAYNETDHLLTAKNVDGPFEWAIALVKEISGVNDPIEGLSEFQSFPNPTDDIVNISFILETPTDLSAKIVNLHGQVMQFEGNKNFTPGKHVVTFDVSHMSAGIYFIELNSGKGVGYLPMMVNSE